MLTSGVAYGSPLAFLLRRLLQNDSLMDIGRRSDLYWGVVRLIQSLGATLSSLAAARNLDCPGKLISSLGTGSSQQRRQWRADDVSARGWPRAWLNVPGLVLVLTVSAPDAGRCVDFIPLFLKPAVDPNDADEGADAESMLDALRTLDVQCRVFKRNAEDLGEPPPATWGHSLDSKLSAFSPERGLSVLSDMISIPGWRNFCWGVGTGLPCRLERVAFGRGSFHRCGFCLPVCRRPSEQCRSRDCRSLRAASESLPLERQQSNEYSFLAESEEEIRALSLALEINNHFEELQKAADVLRSLDDAPGPSQRRSSEGGGAENNEREEDKTAALEKRCETASFLCSSCLGMSVSQDGAESFPVPWLSGPPAFSCFSLASGVALQVLRGRQQVQARAVATAGPQRLLLPGRDTQRTGVCGA